MNIETKGGEPADLIERLRQEAQIHAQEARTANATIAEIYRVVTSGTGEPGNWNGAEPVRKCIEDLRAALQSKACASVGAVTEGASNWHRHHVAVEKAALQMVRNALRTDAEAGRSVRAEMLEILDNATSELAAPAAAVPESPADKKGGEA